jgi:NADH-quinone oxidoreductase subunit L
MTASILILSVLALPWSGALLVWLVGDRRPTWQHGLAVAFSAAAGAAALGLLPFASPEVALRLPFGEFFGDLTFLPDGLGIFLAAVAAIIGCLTVIFSVDYMRGEAQLGRYYALVLIFIGAMCGLVLTSSFLFLFIFWEITALCSYALISFYNDDPKAVAGGMKALIITQVGGIGLLLGALVAYAYTGSFDIALFLERGSLLPGGVLAVMAFGFLIAAAAKSAQFPFQTWLPDAMEAPTPVSALIHAATMVNAGVYLLARFYPVFYQVPEWRTVIMVAAVATALMAAVMAVVSNDLKRVLAYSTVSQLGYMFYAISAGGIFASQFHLLSHAIFKALLFLGAGAVIHSAGTRDMRQMGGLGKELPFIRNVFLLGALALAGLPVLNGFWSKELVLEAGLHHGPVWAYNLMLAGTGLTAFYTFRMVWMVFYGLPAPERSGRHVHAAGNAMKIALAPLALGTLLSWLLVGPFSRLLESTLPGSFVHAVGITGLIEEVFLAPAAYLALAVVGAGLLAWHSRARLGWLGIALHPLARIAQDSFGFEWINHQLVEKTQHAGEHLRRLQTGQINWNLVGIVGGLVFILTWLTWGGK